MSFKCTVGRTVLSVVQTTSNQIDVLMFVQIMGQVSLLAFDPIVIVVYFTLFKTE